MATNDMVIQRGDIQKVPSTLDIGQVLNAAIEKGIPVSELKEAFDLVRDMAQVQRESQFNTAFAKFKRECPPIVRRTEDAYNTVTRNGVRMARMYASLDDISMTVDGALHNNGLSYHWSDSELTKDGCIIRRFVLTHESGFSRSTSSPPIPIEGGEAYKAISAGRKETSASPQQRMGVADTYAKRYSMTSGLGIPTCDEDDDASSHHQREAEPTITEEQARTINDMVIACDQDNKWTSKEGRAAFFRTVTGKATGDKVSDILASKYNDAVKALKKAMEKKAGVA